jgi:hypothetical protein
MLPQILLLRRRLRLACKQLQREQTRRTNLVLPQPLGPRPRDQNRRRGLIHLTLTSPLSTSPPYKIISRNLKVSVNNATIPLTFLDTVLTYLLAEAAKAKKAAAPLKIAKIPAPEGTTSEDYNLQTEMKLGNDDRIYVAICVSAILMCH